MRNPKLTRLSSFEQLPGQARIIADEIIAGVLKRSTGQKDGYALLCSRIAELNDPKIVIPTFSSFNRAVIRASARPITPSGGVAAMYDANGDLVRELGSVVEVVRYKPSSDRTLLLLIMASNFASFLILIWLLGRSEGTW